MEVGTSRTDGVVVITRFTEYYLVECSMCHWRQSYESAHTAGWLAFCHNRNFRKEGCGSRRTIMIGVYDVSEADEAASDKETALRNLRSQVERGETPAIIDMYERAAWQCGATVAETEATIKKGRVK